MTEKRWLVGEGNDVANGGAAVGNAKCAAEALDEVEHKEMEQRRIEMQALDLHLLRLHERSFGGWLTVSFRCAIVPHVQTARHQPTRHFLRDESVGASKSTLRHLRRTTLTHPC